MKRLLIILLVGLLLLAPVYATEVTSKVDDKKIIHTHGESKYFIHTVDFGDIEVTEQDYQEVFINDTVTFNTHSDWGMYTILKINGEDLNVE